MQDNECLKVGEDVIVTEPKSPKFNHIGEVTQVKREPGRTRVGIMFDFHQYWFDVSQIELA